MFSMRNMQGDSEERLVEDEIKNYFKKIKKKIIVIVGFILIIGFISTITAVVTMKDTSPNNAAMTNKSLKEGKNIRGMFNISYEGMATPTNQSLMRDLTDLIWWD